MAIQTVIGALADGTVAGRTGAIRYFRVPTKRDAREIEQRASEIIVKTTDAKLKPRRRRRVIWN